MEIYEYLTMCSNNNLKDEQWAKKEHKQLNNIRNTSTNKMRISKRYRNYEEKPKEILELKNIIIELKNSLGKLLFIKGRLDQQKNQCELKDRRVIWNYQVRGSKGIQSSL